MECPHCHQTLPFLLCSKCGEETPKTSRYCSQCGTSIETVQEKKAEGSDFSDRTVCSDGNCIGIINEKGVCNICGQPYTGEPS
jgi:predicted amidophosphoribosyltransferase